MKRDFSEKAKQELLSLVKEVNDEQWSKGTDWVGDRWIDFEGWIGQLDIGKYVDNVKKYHKKVIDKNNTTKSQIEKIFTDVNDVSTQYRSSFAALLADLNEYETTINLLGMAVASSGTFDAEFVGKGLKAAVNAYLESSKAYLAIADNGLSQEEIDELQNSSPELMKAVLAKYTLEILEVMPDVALGQELELPIGPGTSVYYKVQGQTGDTAEFELEAVAEEQRIVLKKFSQEIVEGISGTVDEDGELGIQIQAPDGAGIEMLPHGFAADSSSVKVGDHTINYHSEIDIHRQEAKFEESIVTEIGNGNVTTTIGIKKTNDSKIQWKPMPVPVEVEAPYPVPSLPYIDWETLEVVGLAVGTVVVIAGVSYAVVATGGGAFALVAL